MPPENNNGPTGREWGELKLRVAGQDDAMQRLEHRIRGDRQVVVDLSERIDLLQQQLLVERLPKLEMQLMTVSTKIYTTISVIAVIASVIGWTITVLAPVFRPAP